MWYFHIKIDWCEVGLGQRKENIDAETIDILSKPSIFDTIKDSMFLHLQISYHPSRTCNFMTVHQAKFILTFLIYEDRL